MTAHQALQLGLALVSWSEGKALEVRDSMAADKNWYPFTVDSYEKINVHGGIEWRTVDRSVPVISQYDPQPTRVKSEDLLNGAEPMPDTEPSPELELMDSQNSTDNHPPNCSTSL